MNLMLSLFIKAMLNKFVGVPVHYVIRANKTHSRVHQRLLINTKTTDYLKITALYLRRWLMIHRLIDKRRGFALFKGGT